MHTKERWAYDIETYPNVFTVSFEHVSDGKVFTFEISNRLCELSALYEFLCGGGLHGYTCDELVGFNNIGFDYPILHMLLTGYVARPRDLYEKAMAIIESNSDKGKDFRFNHLVPQSEWLIPQIDLYKIHHFDNKARATGLKALEFAMHMDNIEDLPFPPGAILNEEQIKELKRYNRHDVKATVLFYHKSREMIQFREELTKKYQRSYMNHNDTKIGKDFFITELERQGIPCFERRYGDKTRAPIQTKRDQICMRDVVLPWIKFKDPDFTRVTDWFKAQTITETKSVFTDLKATVNGLDIYFGLGGIHASVDNRIVRSDEERMILDLDVASYYPNLAITNRFYPAHLGQKFCDIYAELFERRKQHAKGTPQNAALKLALNGVYGDSNNPYSPMYDPLFTMRVTVNGQLLLCKLVDELDFVEVLQMNTDGITISFKRSDLSRVKFIAAEWEQMTGLMLEQAEYKEMMIRDVNNYVAVGTDGKIKRKGAYDYKREWYQNHSMMIVPKVVEKVLTEKASISETIRGWTNMKDFLILRKVNRDCRLSVVGDEREFIQNTSRYVVAVNGKYLFKHMPPLKGKENERINAVEKGYKVHICNDMKDLQSAEIDYSFYEKEVEKLCLILK